MNTRLFCHAVVVLVAVGFSFVNANEPPDPRTRWHNKSYNSTIEYVQGKRWIERSNTDQKVTAELTEISRTAEYVELKGFNFGIGRLFPSRIEMNKNDKWEWVSNGNWNTINATTTPVPATVTTPKSAGSTSKSFSIASTIPTAEQIARVPLRDLDIEPPASLTSLMKSAERERSYQIAECKNIIRDVLDKSNASAATISSIDSATDGNSLIVAMSKAKHVAMNVQQLGSLQQAEQHLHFLQSAVFVPPVLRDFVPNRIGLILNATVVRILNEADERTTTANKRLLVEMPGQSLIAIKSFPSDLVAVGKPLPTADARHAETFYKTIGYLEVEHNGEKKTVALAEILDVSELESYLLRLTRAREGAKNMDLRTWTKQDGKTTFRGEFETFADGRVLVRKIDGTIDRYSMQELSPVDQQYVKTTLKERREPEKVNRKKK